MSLQTTSNLPFVANEGQWEESKQSKTTDCHYKLVTLIILAFP